MINGAADLIGDAVRGAVDLIEYVRDATSPVVFVILIVAMICGLGSVWNAFCAGVGWAFDVIVYTTILIFGPLVRAMAPRTGRRWDAYVAWCERVGEPIAPRTKYEAEFRWMSDHTLEEILSPPPPRREKTLALAQVMGGIWVCSEHAHRKWYVSFDCKGCTAAAMYNGEDEL